MERYLWKFFWDYGRQGSVEGLFVATEEQIENALGKEVHFGEILGKHSDVYGTLDRGDLYKVPVDPNAIEQLVPHLGTEWSGYSPLDYIKCSECGYDEVECQCDDETMEM